MKIRNITCHNVFNYGASLQAYALAAYLRSLGHDVKVIDYMPPYIRKNLGLFAISPKYKRNIFIAFAFYCYVVPIRIVQKKARLKFKSFLDSYVDMTQRYNTYDELKNNPPESDIYFCGSDQIWNTNIGNGLDPAFYLDFAPNEKVRASYAASFSISDIPTEYVSFVKGMLAKMNFISVREKTGLSILNSLGINSGTHVLDPVFLLNKEHWLSMTYVPKYENYILVYDQENSKLIRDIAISISNDTGKKIVSLKDLYPRYWADYQEKYAGPIDFISLIAHADIVITNSFHCCAFSLIMERQFYVINRTHQKVNSRMVDLLSALSISDRMIIDELGLKTADEINYTLVNPILEDMRIMSKSYIDKVLSSC